MSCAVALCCNRTSRKKEVNRTGLVRHRFPTKNKIICKIWVKRCKRADKFNLASASICSDHFTADDYKVDLMHRLMGLPEKRRLKEDAVPSLNLPGKREKTEEEKMRARRREERLRGRNTRRDALRRIRELSSDNSNVEFKAEMWEDGSSKEPDAKKPKNSRKKVLSDNSESNKDDGSSSGTLACCALACPNTQETHSMVRLPQDKELRAQWVGQIRRSLMDWTPDRHSALCEVHFDEAQWDRNEEGERVLRPDAVPSLALHGEAVRSWVTLDGGVLKPGKCNENAEERDSDLEDESDIFIKREALEPEIDMVEGSEAVLSQEDCPRDPFETIYCDSTFREDEDNLNGNPHNVQVKLEQEDEEDYNDESMNPLGDSEGEGSSAEGPRPTALLIKAELLRKKVRRRSAQLTDDFQCPICERKLSRRKNLEMHIKKLHPNGEMSETQKRQKAEEDAGKPKPKKSLKAPPPLAPIKMKMGPVPYPVIGNIFSTAMPSSNLVATHSGVALPSSVAKPPRVAPSKAVNRAENSTSSPKLLASPTIIVQSSKDNSPPGFVKTTALAAGVSTSPSSSIVSSSVVSMPRPNDPSPAGGEIHKQFVLLLPKAIGPQIPPPPVNKEDIFSMNLINVPLDKRLALMEKLKELVDAVVTKKLDPKKIIIAYDRTLEC